jgi:hypothetical protein
MGSRGGLRIRNAGVVAGSVSSAEAIIVAGAASRNQVQRFGIPRDSDGWGRSPLIADTIRRVT